MTQPSVSLIIPTLNEEHSLPHVLAMIPDLVTEVVIVDGGSSDNTVAVARELLPHGTIIKQTRKGKGNALVCGIEAATGDIVVLIDADGSTDPAEIKDFVRVLTDGADFAKGSRFAPGGHSLDLTAHRRWGNGFLNGVVNVLFGTKYSDLCYGYNALWRHRVAELRLPSSSHPERQWGDGFEIETLINIRVAVLGMRIEEVPSVEHARISGVSKLNAVRDGLRVLRTILTEFGARRRLGQAPAAVPQQRQQSAYRAALAPEES